MTVTCFPFRRIYGSCYVNLQQFVDEPVHHPHIPTHQGYSHSGLEIQCLSLTLPDLARIMMWILKVEQRWYAPSCTRGSESNI